MGEPIKWLPFQRLSEHLYSNSLKEIYGLPTCLCADELLLIGTNRGYVLVYDSNGHFIKVYGNPEEEGITQIYKVYKGDKIYADFGSVTTITLKTGEEIIAASYSNGSIVLWGQGQLRKQSPHILPKGDYFTQQTFLPDGSVVALSSTGEIIHLFFGHGILSRDFYRLVEFDTESSILCVKFLDNQIGILFSDKLVVVDSNMKPIFSCDMPIISTDTIPEKVCACLSWNPAVDESLVFSLGDFVAIAKIRTGQNDKSIVRKRTLSGVQIICLEWFTPGFIITIDATYRTRILSDQTLETIEEGSISSLRPVFSNYLKGALISPSFDGKIFLLGKNAIYTGELFRLKERIEHAKNQYGIVEAILSVTRAYRGDWNRVYRQCEQTDIAKVALKLLEGWLQKDGFIFSAEKNKMSEYSESHSFIMHSLDLCITINRSDFFFERMLHRLIEKFQENQVYEVVKKFIVQGNLKSMGPEATTNFLEYERRVCKSPYILEQCLLCIEIADLNIDLAVKICKEMSLYAALCRIYNDALLDFSTPIVYLSQILQHDSKSDSLNVIYCYLGHILSGAFFPSGKRMDNDAYRRILSEVISLLFTEHHENFDHDLSYPVVRILIKSSLDDFLEFVSSSLLGNQNIPLSNVSSNGRIISLVPFIINVILNVLPLDHSIKKDCLYLSKLCRFLAKQISRYPNRVLISPSQLSRIIAVLLDDNPNQENEQALLGIFSSLQISKEEGERYLDKMKLKRYWNVAETINAKQNNYNGVLQCRIHRAKTSDLSMTFLFDMNNILSPDRLIDWSGVILENSIFLTDKYGEEFARFISNNYPVLNDSILHKLDLSDQPSLLYTYVQGIFTSDNNESSIDALWIEKFLKLLGSIGRIDDILLAIKNPKLVETIVDILEKLQTYAPILWVALETCSCSSKDLFDKFREICKKIFEIFKSELANSGSFLKCKKEIDNILAFVGALPNQRNEYWRETVMLLTSIDSLLSSYSPKGLQEFQKDIRLKASWVIRDNELFEYSDQLLNYLENDRDFAEILLPLVSSHSRKLEILKLSVASDREFLKKLSTRRFMISRKAESMFYNSRCGSCKRVLNINGLDMLVGSCGHLFHSVCAENDGCFLCS